MAPAVAMGYAAADTNAGHSYIGHPVDTMLTSGSWSLTSPGNVNLHLLQNFAYRALDDMAWIAKHITKTYYGKDIEYSYWNGCSTGGRQGLSLVNGASEMIVTCEFLIIRRHKDSTSTTKASSLRLRPLTGSPSWSRNIMPMSRWPS